MRTLLNIKLLEQIRQNPEKYIGQRNFDVFESFMLPIDWGTEIQYELEHVTTLEAMPSMHDFVFQELNIEIPSAVRWTWAIGFNVEDQRELLDAYFNWVFKYETQFPFLPENYQFNYKSNDRMQITKQLKYFCHRPAMFGVHGLAGLRALIDGEFYLKEFYDVKLTENEIKLRYFVDYWKSKTDKTLSFDTWDRPFGRERLGINPFSFPDGSNNGWVYERFIDIMTKEVGLELDDITVIN